MASQTSGQHLKRQLGLIGLTLFGVNYMTIVAVFTTYGIVNKVTFGHLAAAYVLALFVMLFTAFAYSSMARRYPVAGSAYTYAQQSFAGAVGFLTGWALLLDYLFIPMINFMLIGIYLHAQFPIVPIWVFTLTALLLVLLFNVLGITLVDKANIAIIALSVILVGIVVALSLKQALGGSAAISLVEPLAFGKGGIGTVASGAAILAISFLGFDAVSTLSEEAIHPLRDIPRAIVLAALVGGFFFILVSWAGGIAFRPDWSTLSDSQIDAAGVTLLDNIGGSAFSTFFVAVYVAGAFGSGMTGQVSVSRILYAMGRDGVLPKAFARLHRRFGTPVFAAVVVSVVALSSLFLSLELAAFMISFGALTAFAVVNLCVIRTHLFSTQAQGTRKGFGRWFAHGVVPAIGFVLTIWLLASLRGITWLVGIGWLVMGVAVIAMVTGGFRRPVPTMDFSERQSVRSLN